MSDSAPSSNWLAMKKQLPSKKRKRNEGQAPAAAKKNKKDTTHSERLTTAVPGEPSTSHSASSSSQGKGTLKQMVLGQLTYSDTQKEPGKYLAIDCEMVGVGINGSESSLARVSLINYHGAVILDEFVRPKEPVVDYRTRWSGIRPKNLINAQSFGVVQQQVASLLKGKILIGHAIQNDLKALLLSHPRPMTRDTQYYAYKFGVCKSSRIALRDLVKQELELTIQSGEHSSVTDARAAMAVYRLHLKRWEKGLPRHPQPSTSSTSNKKKAKAKELDPEIGSSSRINPKKGTSRRGGKNGLDGREQPKTSTKEETSEWWTQLPTSASDADDWGLWPEEIYF